MLDLKNISEASVREIKMGLITMIACNSVRRAMELTTFTTKESANFTFLAKDQKHLNKNVYIFQIKKHKTRKLDQAPFMLDEASAKVLFRFINHVRPTMTNPKSDVACTDACPVFINNSNSDNDEECCKPLTYNQINRGLTSTFLNYTTITKTIIGKGEIT